MKTAGCILLAIGALLLFLFVFATTPTVSGIIVRMFYLHPVAWLLAVLAVVSFVAAAFVADGNTSIDSDLAWIPMWIGTAITIIWLIWLGIQNPIKMAALSQHTHYDVNGQLIPQQEIRPVAYSIASANFGSSISDTRFAPGDLDYVQDHWTASIDPVGFWNQALRPTQGIYVFNNDLTSQPHYQSFTFSERGILWNSAISKIRSHEYFVEFSDVLYVLQPDGKYIAVTTLTKRASFARYPYIYGVAVITSDGFIDLKPLDQARLDPRLNGITLIPEDFEKLRVEAYGWRNGWFTGLFTRTGRIAVQVSAVDSENAAPYLMKSVQGNVWYSPLAPYNARDKSTVGIAMSDAHGDDLTVHLWLLPSENAYPGADFLASLIESSANHININWFRQSGDTKCGNVAVLEMVPLIRQEAAGPKLYYMGYISAAPISSNVKFYAIIDPATKTVYEDLPSFNHVDKWLMGEFELNAVTQNSAAVDPSNGQCLLIDELPQVPDQTLIDYLKTITEELDRRLGQ